MDLRSLAALAAIASGCGDDAPAHHKYEFSDDVGRDCVIVCDGDVCEMDCDVESTRECSGQFPLACFTLAAVGVDPEILSICDSCCGDGGASLWFPEDCSPLVCAVDGDCPPLGGDVFCRAERCVPE